MISSETDDELAMKLLGGIQRRVPKSTIAERKRMDASLMPQGLERTMSEADLVNLVEYLSTLKKGR
jgi:putative heme-binding domain-containing protein